MVMAVACNQTRMFNMAYSDSLSTLRLPGTTNTHHNLTHEEPTDPRVGYQVQSARFATLSMEAFAYFIDAFSKVREGDGSLLDNTVIFANTDTSFAKVHATDNIPMITVGKGGGRFKTGLHVDGGGSPMSRVGFTLLQAMGVPMDAWGTGSLRTSKAISEILA
jgi:hypothetical protein